MDKELIGRKLRSLRGDRTQGEVADAVGISVSTLGMYERGERIARDDIKLSLADYYAVSIDTLFFDTNDT